MATDKPKRPRGRPKSTSPGGRTPAYVIHNRIDIRIGQAIESFRKAQKFKPNVKDIIELALIQLLEKEGFWPPEANADS